MSVPSSDVQACAASPTVGVVVVNWNGWRDTLKAYESLQSSRFARWTLIVVDNASSDGSARELAERIPDAVLIESPINTGFAGGCNLGMRKAIDLGLTYVFLLNNDAFVTDSTLDELIDASVGLGDKAAIGGVLRAWPSGDLQFFGSRRTKTGAEQIWNRAPADIAALDAELIPTDFICGAALFAPTSVVLRVGLLDERFFLNYEETDWCYRAMALGVPRYIVSRATVHHHGSVSVGQYDAPLQIYFLHRNLLLFKEKHAWFGARIGACGWALGRLIDKLRRRIKARLLGPAGPEKLIDPPTRALFLGLRDYALRRFGDCPPEVRELARTYRARDSLQ